MRCERRVENGSGAGCDRGLELTGLRFRSAGVVNQTGEGRGVLVGVGPRPVLTPLGQQPPGHRAGERALRVDFGHDGEERGGEVGIVGEPVPGPRAHVAPRPVLLEERLVGFDPHRRQQFAIERRGVVARVPAFDQRGQEVDLLVDR